MKQTKEAHEIGSQKWLTWSLSIATFVALNQHTNAYMCPRDWHKAEVHGEVLSCNCCHLCWWHLHPTQCFFTDDCTWMWWGMVMHHLPSMLQQLSYPKRTMELDGGTADLWINLRWCRHWHCLSCPLLDPKLSSLMMTTMGNCDCVQWHHCPFIKISPLPLICHCTHNENWSSPHHWFMCHCLIHLQTDGAFCDIQKMWFKITTKAVAVPMLPCGSSLFWMMIGDWTWCVIILLNPIDMDAICRNIDDHQTTCLMPPPTQLTLIMITVAHWHTNFWWKVMFHPLWCHQY